MFTDPKYFRQWLLSGAREEAERHFDPDTLICLIPRETIWYTITLLESGKSVDIELANRILEQIQVNDGTHSPCTLLVIFHRYPHLLSSFAKSKILENLKVNLPISATVRYSDGNVNHPLAAYIHLICGGELLEIPTFTEIGIRYLYEFQKIISSRRHKRHLQAEMAEYNSPTYTALTLWFLAIGAEFAQNQEVCELALFLEKRLWINVALHWHNPSQQFAGPFSRAYGEDSVGGFSALHCTFASATNQSIYINPELPKRFSHPSALIENALIAILNFHVPDVVKKIAFEKNYPTYFRMTTYCEQYHENNVLRENQKNITCFDDEVYSGGWGDLTTYMTDDFCLGTASRPYVNGGQNDIFSLRYRCSENVKNLHDFHGMYTRLVFNKSAVGEENACHTVGSIIDRSYLFEEGRGFVYQHQNFAITNYIPKRQGNKNVSEIRLDLIFSYNSPFDKLMVDNQFVKKLPFEIDAEQKIIIQDYKTYLVILPNFAIGNKNSKSKIWSSKDHLMISFYLYEGENKDFSREQLSNLFFAFACVVESAKRFSDFDLFLEFVDEIELKSDLFDSRFRKTVLRINENEMSFIIEPVAEKIIQRTWNGTDETLFHTQVESKDDLVRDFVQNGPYVR